MSLMKRIGYLTLILGFLLSCKKENKEDGITPHPIHGKWEWFKTLGFGGIITTPQSTGKSSQIEFFPDSSFWQTGNYMTQIMPDAAGRYSLINGSSACSGNGTYIILSSINMSISTRFKLDFNANDTLQFDMGSFCDASILYFVRKN